MIIAFSDEKKEDEKLSPIGQRPEWLQIRCTI
jgi:hypothetical protein